MLDFLQYLPNAFSFMNLLVLILGTIGGLFLGATPGLSPTMAVALLVPFTFYMEPATGLVLLGAVYTATVAGGAISAVLLNIPGAPANIATMMDGHPMAKQGRSQEALYVCFISSLVGGIFGMIIMILFTPPMARLAMEFGPAETFWTGIFGITVMAGLSGEGGIAKGLFSGMLGLIFSCIGYGQVTGEPRYVVSELFTGGIAIIPALIGIYAIPQVFSLVEDLGVKIERLDYKPKKGVLLKTIVMNLKMVRGLTIGSITGAIIGVIPGAGGSVSGLIAYDQNKKFSKHPETLGKGNPEGVAVSESANNAMVGPSLIPLLTLSIPGSPTAAVLLGGLLIHGLFPGPDLFRTSADVTYTFIWSLVLAQIAMCVFGLVMSRYSYLVMSVPNLMMLAAVTILSVYGTYSVQNSFDDVIVMFGLGVLTYVGAKFGFSPSAMVLGIILGPIAEENFLKGKLIAETQSGTLSYFFTGTLNVILIALCVASVGWAVYGEYKSLRRVGKVMTPEVIK